MRVRPLIAAAAAAVSLAACDEAEDSWTAPPSGAAATETAAEAGYLAPPRITGASREGAAVQLEGTAAPNARVRIAPPRGEPLFVQADADGRWSAGLTPGAPVRLFGLSMTEAGRTAQSEGYVLLTADGHVAQLRAGAGALTLAPASPRPRILAVDYDREGGAVVSGVAAPQTELALRVDRERRGDTKTDARGRFSISLAEPLNLGGHVLEVAGSGGADTLRVDITPAGDLGAGPFVGERTAFGWRVDWTPPGGGVQTTLIFERPGA